MVGVCLLFQLAGLIENDAGEWAPTGSTQSPASDAGATELSYDRLAAQVVPTEGKTIPVVWGDVGQKLVAAGAIDLAKFEAQYGGLSDEQRAILQGDSLQQITFTPDNIRFWTNVLWSLGLTQRSKVLSEGPMKQREAEIPLGLRLLGGWTLGSKDATELYNSTRLIQLTPKDERSTGYGAYLPTLLRQPHRLPGLQSRDGRAGTAGTDGRTGRGEEALYAAATSNSYAFANTYITLAAYLGRQGTPGQRSSVARGVFERARSQTHCRAGRLDSRRADSGWKLQRVVAHDYRPTSPDRPFGLSATPANGGGRPARPGVCFF
jgi:hypothetical protein